MGSKNHSDKDIIKYGTKKPKKTKKNKLIRKAVKRALHDYEETYRRLAYE